MEGARLSTSTPGAARGIDALDSLPQYESRVASTPAACAAFVSRRVVVVFTGAVRLAKAVTSSVVDGWRRRAVDVEACLKACVAIAGEMASSLDALGALPSSSFVGAGSEAANAGIEKLADALERHKKIQEKLWPAITSAPVKALYDAIAPLCLGSHICGAGNGGHVVALLKPDATPAAAAAAVAACSDAPEARVVRVQMMLGGGHGLGGASTTAETAARSSPVAPTAAKEGERTKERDESAEESSARDLEKAATAAAATGHPSDQTARAGGAGGSGGRGRGGRGGEGVSGRGRKKRRTG
jgi:fucokinase